MGHSSQYHIIIVIIIIVTRQETRPPEEICYVTFLLLYNLMCTLYALLKYTYYTLTVYNI